MKVIVLGASGFIGLPVALAYARAGHIVYGTTRDAKAARQLAKHEIVPLICPANGAHGHSVWGQVAGDADVVIDTIRSMDSEQPLGALRAVEAISDRGVPGTRVTYIYTGNLRSHMRGAGGLETWSSEQNPHSNNLESGWRREIEEAVLSSDKVNGIVIRPGVLYGRSGSMLEPFLLAPAYDAAKAGTTFDVVGLNETRLFMVHQDDLADLYMRAGERGPLLRGTALVASNPQSERWVDILDAVVRVSGAKGYKLRAPADNMGESSAGYPPSSSSVAPTLRTPSAAFGSSLGSIAVPAPGVGALPGLPGLSPPASPHPRRTSITVSPSPLGGAVGREVHARSQERERGAGGGSGGGENPIQTHAHAAPVPIPEGAHPHQHAHTPSSAAHTVSPKVSAASLSSIASSVSASSAATKSWGPKSGMGPAMETAWASTTNLRPTLSTSLTGWVPHKPGLVDGMDLYWQAFAAHYEFKKIIPAWDLPGVQPPQRVVTIGCSHGA